MCILNGLSMRRILGFRQEIRRTFLLPLVSALIMGIVTFGASMLLKRILPVRLLDTALPVLLAVLVYGLLLVRTGCLNEQELKAFPKGTLLIRIFRKLHAFPAQ